MVDYRKLKVEDLKKECVARDIICKPTKQEIIKTLTLDDQGKLIYHTTQVKQKNGNYIVQIDYRNKLQLIQMSKNIEKKFCQSMGVFSLKKIWYRCDSEFIIS